MLNQRVCFTLEGKDFWHVLIHCKITKDLRHFSYQSAYRKRRDVEFCSTQDKQRLNPLDSEKILSDLTEDCI